MPVAEKAPAGSEILFDAVRLAGKTGAPLIVGEAPSKSGDKYWPFPLSGAVGERLASFAGIEPERDGSRYGRWYWALVDVFVVANVFDRWPGKMRDGKGQEFPAVEAATAATACRLPAVAVLLGRRVAKAYGLGQLPFFEWGEARSIFEDRPASVVVIPHPSAINRRYNEDGEAERAGQALREAIERSKRKGGPLD